LEFASVTRASQLSYWNWKLLVFYETLASIVVLILFFSILYIYMYCVCFVFYQFFRLKLGTYFGLFTFCKWSTYQFKSWWGANKLILDEFVIQFFVKINCTNFYQFEILNFFMWTWCLLLSKVLCFHNYKNSGFFEEEGRNWCNMILFYFILRSFMFICTLSILSTSTLGCWDFQLCLWQYPSMTKLGVMWVIHLTRPS